MKKAGTIIFAMTVVIWFLSNFNLHGLVENVDDSILAAYRKIYSSNFCTTWIW